MSLSESRVLLALLLVLDVAVQLLLIKQSGSIVARSKANVVTSCEPRRTPLESGVLRAHETLIVPFVALSIVEERAGILGHARGVSFTPNLSKAGERVDTIEVLTTMVVKFLRIQQGAVHRLHDSFASSYERRDVMCLIVVSTFGEAGESEEGSMRLRRIKEVSVHRRELGVELRDIGVGSQFAQILELSLSSIVSSLGSVGAVHPLLELLQ